MVSFYGMFLHYSGQLYDMRINWIRVRMINQYRIDICFDIL